MDLAVILIKFVFLIAWGVGLINNLMYLCKKKPFQLVKDDGKVTQRCPHVNVKCDGKNVTIEGM